MKEKIYQIYTLNHPITDEIRYVGFTTNPLARRLSGHVCSSTDDNNYRENWIKKLKKEDLKPVIKLLEIVTEETWVEREQYWIKKFRDEGVNLVNTSMGGDKTRLGAIYPEDYAAPYSKEVHQYSLSGRYLKSFPSAEKAGKQLGISKAAIGQCRIKNYGTAGGYQWKSYKAESVSAWTGMIRRSIVQFTLDGQFVREWKTVREIGSILGFASTNIFKVLSGERTSAGGYTWKYKEDKTPVKRKIGTNGFTRPVCVKHLDTGDLFIFKKGTSAAKYIGITNKALWSMLNNLRPGISYNSGHRTQTEQLMRNKIIGYGGTFG